MGAKHVEEREGIEDSLKLAEDYARAIAQLQPELLDVVAMRRWLTMSPVATKHWEEVGAIRWAISTNWPATTARPMGHCEKVAA